MDSLARSVVPGTQAVARAAALLRLVSSAGLEGAAAAALAREAGLTRPTTHRLLLALEREGLVEQDESGRWVAGVDLYLMGRSAAARFDVADLSRDIVHSLASRTEESAFLSVRRGDEAVCVLREDGSFPIRSFVLHEGKRFPLGVASAGLAILAFLPDHDVDGFLARSPSLAREHGPGHGAAQIRERVAETRARGYSLNPGLIVEGSFGIGAAVFDRAGEPKWALSLTGVQFRFGPDRLPELGRTLLSHAHRLTRRIASSRLGE